VKVYVTMCPGDNGGTHVDVYSRAGAIRVARAAAEAALTRRGLEDTRLDEEALEDFIVVHYPAECEVIE